MPNATLLDLEVTESEINWTDLTSSLAGNPDESLAWFGVYSAEGTPAMLDCVDCMAMCDLSCGEGSSCGC